MAATPTFIFGSKLPRLPFGNMFHTLLALTHSAGCVTHLCMLVGVASLTFRKFDQFDPHVKQDMAQVDIFQLHVMSHSFDTGKYAEGAIEYSLVSRLNVAPISKFGKSKNIK